MRKAAVLLLTAALLSGLILARREVRAAFVHSTEACKERMVRELTAVHQDYRSVVFGSRTDLEGEVTALTGGKASSARAGIFETKERLTSELVEPLVESYRTYRCLSLAVCNIVTASANQTSLQPVTISVLGCKPVERTLYGECLFGHGLTDTEGNVLFEPAQMAADCRQILEDSLVFERSVLKAVVAYDSGYRATLQHAGMFDALLKHLPLRTFEPIRQMVNFLGKLHQIPCYLGQCDLPSSAPSTP